MCPASPPRTALAALSRHRALVCLLVVVVLAGCAGLFENDPDLANGEEAARQFDSLDSYNATVTLEFTTDNETTVWTGRQVVAPGTGKFYERLEGPNGTEIAVSNGDSTWLYTPGSDKAQRLDHGGIDETIVAEIRAVVAAAHAEKASNSDGSIRLLPFVPQFRDGSEATQSGPSHVAHEGTETVAGRDAHVLTVDHVDDDYTVRHYLDTEYYVPLKTTGRFTGGEESMSYTLTYEDIEFEPDLPPDLFEFTPPEDASVQESPFEEDEFPTPAALEAEASMTVPEPEVPPGFSLSDAERVVPGAETVELTYTSEQGELTVAKTNVTLSAATPDDQVDIGGVTADYTDAADHNSVTWTCEGNYYSVRGDLDRALLVDVASSITCA